MVPNKDIYADKNGNVTEDPEQFAFQVATAGVELDERIAKRYGIEDSLVSIDEPHAVRKVIGRSEPKPKPEKETEPEPKAEKPEAEAAEPKADKAVAEKPAKKAEAKKGAKNNV